MAKTETEKKLDDTRIQLELAMSKANVSNLDIVRSCINAFISNARSVTFTMQKEFSSSEKFVKWYEAKKEEMKSNLLLKYFNEQRVISIHQRSLQPNKRTIEIIKVEQAGQIIGTGGFAIVYEFEGFDSVIPGDNGNVFRLCNQHYSYLEQLVKECLKIIN